MALKFTLARRLGRPNIDDKEKEKGDKKMVEEHNLFNMPQQQDQNENVQEDNVEDKVIDVDEDLKLENDTNENENQDNNENENERNDENVGELHELNVNTNTNWENEEQEDQEMKDKLKMQNFPSMSNQKDKKIKENELWSFSPVIPVYKNGDIKKYICIISAYDLATFFENSIIKFVPSIQRGSKTLPSGKEKDNFSTKHVKEIFKAFTDNKIFGNTIVLNYSLDNESELIYNPDENKISGKNFLQAVDCSHRARAAIKWKLAWTKHPEQYDDPRQFQFSCEINNVSDNEARQMFAEYNNFSLRVNKTRSSFLDVASDINKIVRKIMSESDLKGRIETVSTGIKSNSPSIVTFGILVNAIKANYNPQTKQELEDVKNYLVKYIDKLVSVFPKFMANSNLEERNQLKTQFFTIEPLAWSSYIALSKSLYGQENWEEKLNKLNTRVQFEGWEGEFLNRENPIFRKVLREKNKIINTTGSVKWINTVFIKFVNENKSLDEIAKEDQ